MTDILLIDKDVKQFIQNEKKNIGKYRKQLEKKHDLELESKIEDIESGAMYAEYILLTEKLLIEYNLLVNIHVNVSFFEKKVEKVENKRITEIVNEFLDIAKKYIPINSYKTEKPSSLKCECGNTVNFIYSDNTIYCEKCSIEIQTLSSVSSFKDIYRVNITQKYKYQRKVHFRDTVNQYQGKQNKKTTDEELNKTLELEFEKMGLLTKSNNWHESHSIITKDIIYIVLNQTGNNKRYEDINYIHNYFTGISCPDISHLEPQLFKDFDKVVEAYDSLPSEIINTRTNFLNSKYVLYQLLRIHNYKVNKEDFDTLKTRERLVEHDNIWLEICKKLEFPFKPCV